MNNYDINNSPAQTLDLDYGWKESHINDSENFSDKKGDFQQPESFFSNAAELDFHRKL